MNMDYEFPSLGRSRPAYSEPAVPAFVPVTAINLEDELLAQYNRAQQLLHDASYNQGIPLNQKAQALNSATAILAALTKSQSELYSSERFKKIENILIDTLKEFTELSEAFMARYREVLGND